MGTNDGGDTSSSKKSDSVSQVPEKAVDKSKESDQKPSTERRKTMEEIKAEARAFAMSDAASKKKFPARKQKELASQRANQQQLRYPSGYPPHPYPPHPYYPPPPHYYGGQPPPPGAIPPTKPQSSTTNTGGKDRKQQQTPQNPPPYYPPYPYPYYPHHYPPVGAQVQPRQHPSKESLTRGRDTKPGLGAAGTGSAVAQREKQTPPTNTKQMTQTSVSAESPSEAIDPGALDGQVTMTAEALLSDENLNDYDRLVRGLNFLQADDMLELFQDDDEDEYNVQESDNDDDDEGEADEDSEKASSGTKASIDRFPMEDPPKDEATMARRASGSSSQQKFESSEDAIMTEPIPIGLLDDALHNELEEELGWLEEEDMEAAVASLLDPKMKKDELSDPSNTLEGSRRPQPLPMFGSEAKLSEGGSPKKDASPSKDPRETTPHAKPKTSVTVEQMSQLKSLLKKHHQLLVQQAVLTVRAAHYHKYHRSRTDRAEFLAAGETSEDLVEILDAAVGMLQDLGNNRKDAIRHSLQFQSWERRQQRNETGFVAKSESADQSGDADVDMEPLNPWASPASDRRLTRAQFNRTLIQQSKTEQPANTVFDIRGLLKLDETFALIDKSVGVGEEDAQTHLLELDSAKDACEYVLDATKQMYEKELIPGSRDLSANFCDPTEFFGPDFKPPSTLEQQAMCRRDRNLFSAGEDNLVLRGVNLYGEKQWVLISDRFLPERSTNIISQRYSKLCVMLYKANGIKIDENGKLEKPPKHESVDDIDETAMSRLKPVPPPAVLNVHRWSLEEDLTLLSAVPITGPMWAEVGARLIPHRDRGHLRKRYQVLERRVKSTVERSNRSPYSKIVGRNPPRLPKPDGPSSSAKDKIVVSEGKKPPLPSQALSLSGSPRSSGSPGNRSTPPRKSAVARAGVSTASRSPHYHMSPPAPHPAHYGSPYGYYPPGPPPFGSPYAPYGPPTMYPHYSHSHQGPPPYPLPEEGSRAAFEQLAREGPGDSQMNELMKAENIAASAMANDLARSPSKHEVERQRTLEGKTEQRDSDRMSADSSAEKRQAKDSPAVNQFEFGTPSKAMFPHAGDNSMSPAGFHRSPADGAFGSMSMASFPGASHLGYSQMTPPEHSLDSTAMERLAGAPHSGTKRKALFQDSLADNDLETEAISGLNLMANSPAVPPSEASESSGNKDKTTGGSSLFSKVVGNSSNNNGVKGSSNSGKDGKKQRKLVFE